jgi:hypothetical protein
MWQDDDHENYVRCESLEELGKEYGQAIFVFYRERKDWKPFFSLIKQCWYLFGFLNISTYSNEYIKYGDNDYEFFRGIWVNLQEAKWNEGSIEFKNSHIDLIENGYAFIRFNANVPQPEGYEDSPIYKDSDDYKFKWDLTFDDHDYVTWDEKVNECVQHFHKRHGMMPSALFANSDTYEKINDSVKTYGSAWLGYYGLSEDEEEMGFDGYKEFKQKEYTLKFCIDDDIVTDGCRLAEKTPSEDEVDYFCIAQAPGQDEEDEE